MCLYSNSEEWSELVEDITEADKPFYSVIVNTYQEPAYVKDSQGNKVQ